MEMLGNRVIRHIRKDGTVQDSMEGVQVPKDISDLALRTLYAAARKQEEKENVGAGA